MSNEQEKPKEQHGGYCTLADLCLVLDEKPSVILEAIHAIDLKGEYALSPGQYDEQALYAGPEIDRLIQNFNARRAEGGAP